MNFILTWIISFVIALILTGIIYAVYQYYQEYRIEHPSDEEIERKKQEQEEFHQQYNDYKIKKQAIIDLYGPITKDFYIFPFDINKAIFFFDNSRRVWFLGHNIPYEKILDVNETDKYSEITETTYKTKTNNGNMAKRAIVGGAIGGIPGAMIGAATSSTSTTSSSHRRYLGKKLKIILDDMNTPSITLEDVKFEIYYNSVEGKRYYEEFDNLCSILKAIVIKNQSRSSDQLQRKVDDSIELVKLQNKQDEIRRLSHTESKIDNDSQSTIHHNNGLEKNDDYDSPVVELVNLTPEFRPNINITDKEKKANPNQDLHIEEGSSNNPKKNSDVKSSTIPQLCKDKDNHYIVDLTDMTEGH